MGKAELKEERMKILELLSKGIITADEAEKLLAALSAGDAEPEIISAPKKKDQFKMLKVLVDSADGDEVRIELPIEFAKLLKNKKLTHIDDADLDIDVDSLIQMINAGVVGEIVNVKSADGDIVKIVVE
ncbi:MAG TPA: hypothetical protein PKU69_04030 [Bacillota bacterium]|nr:hypothetical protein [Bacillota bacterium]HPJ23305.1 hypothetical protein [Bacillota bacterium]